MAENEKIDGFKFAITLLTAFGTILFVVNNYIQNNAITNPKLYYIIYSIISIGTTISGISLVYILIKGISTGVTFKECWEKLASFIYLFTIALMVSFIIRDIIIFFIKHNSDIYIINGWFYGVVPNVIIPIGTFIIHLHLLSLFTKNLAFEQLHKQIRQIIKMLYVLLVVLFVIWVAKTLLAIDLVIIIISIFVSLVVPFVIWVAKTLPAIDLVIIIISFILFVWLYIIMENPHKIEPRLKQNIWPFVGLIVVAFVGLYLVNDNWSAKVSGYFTEGRATISMDDICFKKDIVVPVSVEITGYNNGTNITLFQKNSTNDLVPIAMINLKSKYDPKRKIETDYLFDWDEIPGNDNEIFIKFLIQKYDIDWVKTANIEKIDGGKTIKMSSEKNSLSLRLNDEKTKANLKINGDRKGEFIARNGTKYGKLNIYETGNNSTLVGNAIDDKRYNIFINTSNLPVGYYELMIDIWETSKKYSKEFYLS